MSETNDVYLNTSNTTNSSSFSCYDVQCIQGLLLPLWDPDPVHAELGDRIAWAVLYCIFMFYMFVGVSMISDVFVAGIEKIISQKRRVKVVSPTSGAEEYVSVPVWNETVANLTLVVLGSSAPEICLTLVEVIRNDFTVGKLGPGTIVGAGAYNLFIIQGICIGSVVRGKTKRIKELPIYFVTAAWAIFAYVWLYIILVAVSEGRVEIWEALLTLFFFPCLVISAWVVDRSFFGLFAKIKKRKATVAPSSESSSPVPASTTSEMSESNPMSILEHSKEVVEKREKRYLEIVDELRIKMPNKTAADLQQLAAVQLLKELPKGRGYYRMQAARGLSGAGDVINVKKLQEMLAQHEDARRTAVDKNVQTLAFDPDTYSVMEDVGVFYVHVTRTGAGLDLITTVRYRTKDGTGKAGIDYDETEGTLVFNTGEKLKQIPIHMIDDDEFTDDNQFYVELSNPLLITTDRSNQHLKVVLAGTGTATINKMDDDQGGVFHFEDDELEVDESAGELAIHVIRGSGVKGNVEVPIRFEAITAVPSVHYEEPAHTSVIYFDARQTEQTIRVKIVNEGKLKKNRTFKVELGEPTWNVSRRNKTGSTRKSVKHKRLGAFLRLSSRRDSAMSSKKYEVPEDIDIENELNSILNNSQQLSRLGRPRLGAPASVTVTITESAQLRATMDEIANTNLGDLVTTSTWPEQFHAALFVEPQYNPETGEKRVASLCSYIVHFLTLFWKLIIATVPPAGYLQGWLCFMVCLFYMGLMTALIGDLASHLGCTVGLRDEMVAISLVAFGTSMPDMFASRLAAIREETADAAIGPTNGAVAINVFLGLGLSWTVAAIYQITVNGVVLKVPPGSLTFTFSIFVSFSLICILVVLLRRLPPIYGELGGPPTFRNLTVILFFILWIIYIVLSALDNYCIINPF